MQRNHMVTGLMSVLAAMFALVFSSAAIAQMGQQGGPQVSEPQQEFMEIQQRLAQAQRKAVENNPELQDKADALEELVTDKMRAAGHDPGSIMETMLAAQARLEAARTDAERQQVLESQEVREAQRKMQEAQRAAMQDPEVQAAQQSLQDDMLSAMRREEPETDRLIERLREIQRGTR